MAKKSDLTIREVLRALGSLLLVGVLLLVAVVIATCATLGGIRLGMMLLG